MLRNPDFTLSAGPGLVPDRPDQHGIANYVDVAALLDGDFPEPPKPRYGPRTDGVAIFYAGQVNSLFGDPESGKTWVALAASAKAMIQDERVLVIDLDHNGPESTVARLLALGAPAEVLRSRERFRYIEPEDRGELRQVVDDTAGWPPNVVVVDSLGELMPLFGSNSNSADEFTVVHSSVLKPLARTGAAVVVIDHLSKGSDSRTYGPGGTAAKRRAIGGTSIRVRAKVAFTPGKGGSAYLTVNKDRHGGLRRYCPTGDREPLAGVFHLRAFTGDVLEAEVVPPADGESAPPEFGISGRDPEKLAADVSELGDLNPPPRSKRDVMERMEWGSDRATSALAAWREKNGK